MLGHTCRQAPDIKLQHHSAAMITPQQCGFHFCRKASRVNQTGWLCGCSVENQENLVMSSDRFDSSHVVRGVTVSVSSWLGVNPPFSRTTTLSPAAASRAEQGPAPAPDPTMTASHFTTIPAPASSSNSLPSGCKATQMSHRYLCEDVTFATAVIQQSEDNFAMTRQRKSCCILERYCQAQSCMLASLPVSSGCGCKAMECCHTRQSKVNQFAGKRHWADIDKMLEVP